MKKLIHKLLLCLMAFTIVFSTFGGAVALASSSTYYKPNKTINGSVGLKIHKNNFPKGATAIEYKLYVNGKLTAGATHTTSVWGNYADGFRTMHIGKNVIKQKGNSVKVQACYMKNSAHMSKNYCKSDTLNNLSGSDVDNKGFQLQIDKNGIVKLKKTWF